MSKTHITPAAIPATLLIVDDIEANRNVLFGLTESLGHSPVTAEDGQAALAMVQEKQPDLILLDILMPEMDGYEVLDRLKASPDLRYIPVIVISAVDEMDSVIRCIEKGADDYLIKPFNRTLLKARIHASLDKKRMRDQEEAYRRQISDYNLKLEAKVAEKTRELEAAYERLSLLDKAKSDFLRLVSRELGEPLENLIGPVELLFRGGLPAAAQDDLKRAFRESYERVKEFVVHAKLLTEIELADEKTLWLKPAPLRSLLTEAVTRAQREHSRKSVTIGAVPKTAAFVQCNMEWMCVALTSLLKSALKLASPHSEVALEITAPEGERVSVVIRAAGISLDENLLPNFFKLFTAQHEQRPLDSELGLEPAVAERIIAVSGGSVSVHNQRPAGIVFTVTLKQVETPMLYNPQA